MHVHMQHVFALSNIELTSTTWPFTNQSPTFPTTTFTLPAWTTTFTIPINDSPWHYVWEYGDTSVTNEAWSTVDLDHELCDPVVVWSPTYDVAWSLQRTKRFKNLDQDSFEAKVSYNNGTLSTNTDIDWIVLESWSHTLTDGTKIQAWSSAGVSAVQNATPNTDVYLWNIINFSPGFSWNPGVLHAVTSENDATWIDSKSYGTSWWRWSEPSTTQMSLTLTRSFASTTHDPEDIDWIAFDATHLTTNSIIFDSLKSADNIACCVAGTGYPVPYTSAFPNPPQTHVVAQLWEDGWNGWFAVTHSNAATTAQSYVSIDEDGPWADRAHTDEPVGQIAISNNAWYFVTKNILTHTIWWTDAWAFTVLNSTGYVANGIQLELDNPPSCGNQTYTITVQSSDNHHCDAQTSSATTITINYVFTDTDSDGVVDCEDVCDTHAWGTPTWWPSDLWDTCNKTSTANICWETTTTNGNIICDGSCDAATPVIPTPTDADNDTYPDCQDCNDSNASINPWATETCNWVDMDCDWTVDEWCNRYCDDDDNDWYITSFIYSMTTTAWYEKLCSAVPNSNWWGCSWSTIWVWYTWPSCWVECTPSDGRTQNDADSDVFTYPWAPELCDIVLTWSSWYMFDHAWDQDCSSWSFNTLDDTDSDTDNIPACADNCPATSNTDQADSNWYQDGVGAWDVCEIFCWNGLLDDDEECDDGNITEWDGCSSTCELEYCRDDAPLHDTTKNFVLTDVTPTNIAWTSAQPLSKIALCFEDTGWSRDIFYTTTDSTWAFTYTPDLTPYSSSWVSVGVMLHNENNLDIDHHALVMMK